MNIKSLYRFFILFVGICTVAVILLSKAFYPATETTKEKDSKAKTEVAIHAPSDVASQSNSVDVTQHHPALITTLQQDETREGKFTVVTKTFTTLFKTLFRVIISPNAP
jgi:LAS superfamily LD-carboxypeptidase LdcB